MTETTTLPACRIYGIKNCDTVKKALLWCDEHGISYAFHDYKKLGVPRESLLAWCHQLGWKTLLNTKGPTWRKLSPEQQTVSTQSQAVALMIEHSSLVRRPVIETPGGHLLVGFDPTRFESQLK